MKPRPTSRQRVIWVGAARCCWSRPPALLPFLVKNYRVFQFNLVLVYAIAILGLNILTGFNGQISLGHGAFYAIGAYAAAVLMDRVGMPYWATLPVAGVLCFVLGFLMGFPALRLGGHYLAVATLALALAVPQLLKYKHLEHYTGGVQGIVLVKPEPPFTFRFLDQPFSADRWLYFFTLAVTMRDVRAGVEPAARPRRPRADRHPRPPDRRRRDGHQPADVQVADLRRLGGVHRRGRRARRDGGGLRLARQLHRRRCRSSCSWAWSSAAWPRSRARSSARSSSSSSRTSPTRCRSRRPRRSTACC